MHTYLYEFAEIRVTNSYYIKIFKGNVYQYDNAIQFQSIWQKYVNKTMCAPVSLSTKELHNKHYFGKDYFLQCFAVKIL